MKRTFPAGTPGAAFAETSRAAALAAVLVLALASALSMAGCASAPAVPQWTLKTPEPDAADTFFTGSGTGKTAAEALGDATSNLVASVMQYMGTQVTVQTSATAKASLDSYRADLTQVVSTEASGRLAGFRVKDKKLFADPKTGTSQAYILAAYSTAELSRERKRIQDLMQEKIDSVALPEREGDAFLADAKPQQAIRKYLEAAVAATAPGIENPRQKAERNLSKARSALAGLTLALEGPRAGEAGKAPREPFVATLRHSAQGIPVAGAAINLAVPRKLASGRIGARTETLTTDASGRITYMAGAPDFTGAGRVSASLELGAEMELAYSLPKEYAAFVTALENDAASKTADLDWMVASASRGKAFVTAILESDEKGNPASGRPGASGLQEALMAEGVAVSQAQVPADVIRASDDARVLAAARSAGSATGAGPGTGAAYRITYGVFGVVSVARDGAMFVATASGFLRTLDSATGALLHSAERTARAPGDSEATAARAALAALGRQVFGKELAGLQ